MNVFYGITIPFLGTSFGAACVFFMKKSTMMFLAVTLHNIPEGMAVGVVYAGFINQQNQITAVAALALSIGIAIQNFPEGAIVSMPLSAQGMKKMTAFLCDLLCDRFQYNDGAGCASWIILIIYFLGISSTTTDPKSF